MRNGRFGVIDAVRNGYAFVGREWRYLVRIGAGPLLAYAGTAFLIQKTNPGAGMIEVFLWSLPANVAVAWFLFAQARLLLLGERVDRLPAGDAAHAAARRRAMTACIAILLLFDMAMTSVHVWVTWSVKSRAIETSAPVTASVFFLFGAVFWGLRFSVVHILAAVDYPIRAFLRRVHGLRISARLVGMGLLCVLPVYLPLELVLSAAYPGPARLEPGDLAFVALLGAPFAVVSSMLLNAAGVFALKEILGGKGDVP